MNRFKLYPASFLVKGNSKYSDFFYSFVKSKQGFSAQGAVDGIKYWDQDWRKEGLVGRRYELVKEINFYNQLYCGCEFSQENTACE